MAKKVKTEELIWADEVLEVYQNLGKLAGNREWTSTSASHLFDWAMREENEKHFLATMVPKAVDLKSKFGITDVTDAVVAIDTKTIADLSIVLHAALQASQQEQEPEPRQVIPESEPTPEMTLDDILS